MFCRKCGKELPEYATFCSKCGIKVEILSPTANEGIDTNSQNDDYCSQTPESPDPVLQDSTNTAVSEQVCNSKQSAKNRISIKGFAVAGVIAFLFLAVWFMFSSDGLHETTIKYANTKLTVLSPVELKELEQKSSKTGDSRVSQLTAYSLWQAGTSERFVFKVNWTEVFLMLSEKDRNQYLEEFVKELKTTRPSFVITKKESEKYGTWDGSKIIGQTLEGNITHKIQCLVVSDQNKMWLVYIEYDDSDKKADELANKIIKSVKPTYE
ncbi:zinc ribbon domain-containing protein [Anaerovibrio lipolyticus]|uniref:zinc ribbon domain-containing protein n=1 Tax=Anaerovibrio lipolyticus TaxID=82374 RepID=UPI000482D840|nr:zinc ribbon domain-containing protein [Anaerovibrio lipolyticus]